ncbi:MoaD/ThiS family protein [Myxococcota bacterium]|nr:MoaD/ThiS family protein [Myxococcota bacterium]
MPVVTLRYFATLRESRGVESEPLTVDEGETAASLYAKLFPREHAGGLRVAFAINRDYVPPGEVLHDGDELCFLPPLGGG